MSDIRVSDILSRLEGIAPVEMKLDFDNVGHLVGRLDAVVSRVLVALDITEAVIDEAIAVGAELIVSHHPIIFRAVDRVTDADGTGRKLLRMARHDIGAICMHTNLDAVSGGVNDQLAAAIGLVDTDILWEVGVLQGTSYGLGRVGALASEQTMPSFLAQVKNVLAATGLRYHDAGLPVRRVAVMGGSGSDALDLAIKAGCDTFVLGEAKYNTFLEAKERGINLIEADHFCTENVVSEPLRRQLSAWFPTLTVCVSERLSQTAQFFID